MRFKLDENLGKRGLKQLSAAGYDAVTVAFQNMQSTSDNQLIAVCEQEKRCLITMDSDFADPIRFKPALFHGIVIFKFIVNPTRQQLEYAFSIFIEALHLDV